LDPLPANESANLRACYLFGYLLPHPIHFTPACTPPQYLTVVLLVVFPSCLDSTIYNLDRASAKREWRKFYMRHWLSTTRLPDCHRLTRSFSLQDVRITSLRSASSLERASGNSGFSWCPISGWSLVALLG
jgi:hypothetical protein